jgi:hypothetical protein
MNIVENSNIENLTTFEQKGDNIPSVEQGASPVETVQPVLENKDYTNLEQGSPVSSQPLSDEPKLPKSETPPTDLSNLDSSSGQDWANAIRDKSRIAETF